MKEMVYSNKRKVTVLDNNVYNGYHYVILSLGSHPCAYVEIPEGSSLYKKDEFDIDNIECHGGLTYGRDYLHLENDEICEGWFIGWDYAHFGDALGGYIYNNCGEKCWTMGEIFEELKKVIEQIIAIDDMNKSKEG